MPRARELGIAVGSLPPAPLNAITDVAGVAVGHATVHEGDNVRTGVTVVLPHERSPWAEPVFAGAHRLNGNGELTGLEWIRESGMLHSPVGLTNTHSVGVVRDALVAWEVEQRGGARGFWSLPVVGETWDGVLSDVNGMHVTAEHVRAALASASGGLVPEGSVGSGTGMICHGFKGGIGTASRVAADVGGAIVGVLVQANHGTREQLRVVGYPVGAALPTTEVPAPGASYEAGGTGSIIVVVATDAYLVPGQCARLAQRAGLGVARAGGLGENFSGDLFLAFATGNRGLPPNEMDDGIPLTVDVRMLSNRWITPLFQAVVEATEEAILNALLAAETTTGCGATAHALAPEQLLEALTALGWRPGEERTASARAGDG
ncbi:MAG: P1 family peptidase [Actinomycetota bacterium]|nr:P1 family peptidase [Actinomycetota bacterium]